MIKYRINILMINNREEKKNERKIKNIENNKIFENYINKFKKNEIEN